MISLQQCTLRLNVAGLQLFSYSTSSPDLKISKNRLLCALKIGIRDFKIGYHSDLDVLMTEMPKRNKLVGLAFWYSVLVL